MGAGFGTAKNRITRFSKKPDGGMLALLGLQVLFEYGRPGADRPPVTFALLLANTLVYLRIGDFDAWPLNCDVSFNPFKIIEYGQWSRLFLSAFFHGNEPHIFYNMTSFLWIGSELEASMGSARFASMVTTLLGLSQGITLLLSKGLLLLGDGTSYYMHHSVGFSGVLFGMKLVQTAWSDDIIPFGLTMPTKYITWAELFLTQATFPKASFLGHLGGILAGYAYLLLKRLFGGPEPRPDPPPIRIPRHRTGRAKVSRHASARETPRGIWRCSTCTYDNSLATDICDMCSTAREGVAFSRRRCL